MIAAHLEPKGLSPDTPPLDSKEPDTRTRKAIKGSRLLRNAILQLQGIELPIDRRRVELCPTCFTPTSPQKLWIASIQQTVAAYYAIPGISMTSGDRKTAKPRQVAMYLASELTNNSISEIARRFKKDHTTVLHAIKAVCRRSETDDQEAYDVSLLRERLAV